MSRDDFSSGIPGRAARLGMVGQASDDLREGAQGRMSFKSSLKHLASMLARVVPTDLPVAGSPRGQPAWGAGSIVESVAAWEFAPRSKRTHNPARVPLFISCVARKPVLQ
jgi:hypothetical protein